MGYTWPSRWFRSLIINTGQDGSPNSSIRTKSEQKDENRPGCPMTKI